MGPTELKQESRCTNKLTVIHAVHRWVPQTQNWIYNQVISLPSEIQSHVVCKRTENLEQFPFQYVHALSNGSIWRNLWDRILVQFGVRHHLGFFAEQAKHLQAQVLHSHFGHMGWANIPIARRADLKHVVTFYGLDVNHLPVQNPVWLERYRLLFEHIDSILCEGPAMARSIVGMGCPESKVRVHHLGVNIDEIPFKPRRWTAGQPLRCLIAAAFREKKGIPYALDALGALQWEVPIEITIIGDANETRASQTEKKAILETIARHDLQKKCRLLGYQSHAVLLDEAYRHHIFVSPSVVAGDGDTEGGAPVSIIEMAASGMPIVSTRHCDIPEVIRDGTSGLLADERDVDGLVHHLRWLCSNTDRWNAMLEAGRRRVEKEYDTRIQGQRLAAIYKELCLS